MAILRNKVWPAFWLGWWLVMAGFGESRAQPATTFSKTFQVVDEQSHPVRQASISASTETGQVLAAGQTDSAGNWVAYLPSGKTRLRVVAEGFFPRTYDRNLREAPEVFKFVLEVLTTQNVIIQDTSNTQLQSQPFLERIPIQPAQIQNMPSPLASIERVVSDVAGGTTSEFSSQYRIRGGSYDENLVYINGVEIYRPQLVRAGWQEGLPISNYLMASEVAYSAGGFSAQYGDKLSSVLDIEYRTPTRFQLSAEAGILTQNLTAEGVVQRKAKPGEPERHGTPGKFTYLVGARRFSMAYLLGTLDTQGEYQPLSWDVQGVVSYVAPNRRPLVQYRQRRDGGVDTIYRPAESLKFSVLSITSYNNFRLQPRSRETTFGTIQLPIRLIVGFIGEEQYRYLTNQTALVADHKPNLRFSAKYVLTVQRSMEDELIDTEGGYRLGDVNANLGSDEFGEITFIRGIGSELRRSRNFLTLQTAYASADWSFRLDKNLHRYAATDFVRHTLLVGARVQREWVDDRLKEWWATDSVEYISLRDLISATNTLITNRAMGFVQYNLRPTRTVFVNAGLRANYGDVNEQVAISPRLQVVVSPAQTLNPRRQYQFRFATGYYYQPPFYRELRNLQGELNLDVRAQRAIHFIAGADWQFRLWNRPFKLFAEAYYKKLDNLVPYEIENVRVRYFSNELATGYAYGMDVKVNGQFIPGLDSYFRVSYLDTKERLASEPDAAWVRRPTDQRFVFNFYFQDHLPRTNRVKAHINLVYGTGIPFGPPANLAQRTVFQMPAYQRVDLGISYLAIYRIPEARARAFSLESLWATLEVFNLFQRQNTISYNWVTDLYGARFAVPNYLSQRLLNLRVVARF